MLFMGVLIAGVVIAGIMWAIDQAGADSNAQSLQL